MITALDRKRWSAAKSRYERWEGRTVARFTHWGTRRRWAVFVFTPTLLVCCGGTAFGIPSAWLWRVTAEASKGAPSPDAAADEYLTALGYNTEEGLLPILDDDRQDDLLAEWRAYRKAMDGTKPPPSRLDFGALHVGPRVDGQVEVTVDVSATWWGTDGRALAYSSDERQWLFRARENHGWQVVAVQAPAWCGGYVRLDACALR